MATLYKRWLNECGRKTEYPSDEAAGVVARQMMEKAPGDHLGTYACPWPPETHPHWHVGHQPKVLPASLPPDERIAARLAMIDASPVSPTPWQYAYREDVGHLLSKLATAEGLR